jgi:predicted ATPase/class 3 adenylate cyclase
MTWSTVQAGGEEGEDPGKDGTFTFLFTDIVGSTAKWRDYEDEMDRAQNVHNDIVDGAFEEFGAVYREHIGDGTFSVFRDAVGAVNAACHIQRKMSRRKWPVHAQIAIRAGIHTGRTYRWASNSFRGDVVNRAARLHSIAHGGQTVISEAVLKIVRSRLRRHRITFSDLGYHALKGTTGEHVYQLCPVGLPSSFPPLRSPGQVYHFPASEDAFIGRRKELSDLENIVSLNRLTTLAGIGGIGKTRLALEAGERVKHLFEDGVWFANLMAECGGTATSDVAASIASQLDVPVLTVDGLINHFSSKDMLLILDNCEARIEQVRSIADSLLGSCRNLRIVVTSRAALRRPDEAVYRVLPFAPPNLRLASADTLLRRSEAASYFYSRIRKDDPSFKVTELDVEPLIHICRLLGSIPLAMNLCAGHYRLGLVKLAAMLRKTIGTAVGVNKSRLQATMDGVIKWAYEQCSENEKLLWRQLTVFTGGWTIEAATTVCLEGAQQEFALSEHLNRLFTLGLVEYDRGNSQSPARFRMLDPIREYGKAKLSGGPDAAFRLKERHLNYFLVDAMRARPLLEASRFDEIMPHLKRDLENFRAALQSSSTVSSRSCECLRMATAIWRFWQRHGNILEGAGWLEQGLSLCEQPNGALLAEAHQGLATFALTQWDLQGAVKHARISIRHKKGLPDLAGKAESLMTIAIASHLRGSSRAARRRFICCETLWRTRVESSRGPTVSMENKRALKGLGDVLIWLGNLDLHEFQLSSARCRYEESLEVYRELGLTERESLSLFNLGLCAHEEWVLLGLESREQLPHDALSYYAMALRTSRRLHLPREIANVRNNAGNIYRDCSKFKKAEKHYSNALRLYRALQIRSNEAATMWNLGISLAYDHRPRESWRQLKDSYATFRSLGDEAGVALSIEGFAALSAMTGKHIDCARLLGAASRMWEETKQRRSLVDQPVYDRARQEARDVLGVDVFEAAFADGQRMSAREVHACAMPTVYR